MIAPPHDLDAERALLGDMLSSIHVGAADAAEHLVAEDFYSPLHALVFAAAMELRSNGERVDVMTVRDELRRQGEKPDHVALMDLATMGGGASRRYADTIANHALSRRIIRSADGIANAARLPGADAGDVLGQARAVLDALDTPVGDAPPDLYVFDDFLDRQRGPQSRWVIRGILRVGWRTMIVAPEGMGKSMLFRQFAVLAAQGVHPLRFTKAQPVRTLLVDLENPEDAIISACLPIREKTLDRVGPADYEPGRAWLWHRPQGLNLRVRADRVKFERVVAATNPDLVTLGPVYKCYRVAANESDELAAGEVQALFDDLRHRYSFALMLEHHAPKTQKGVRDLLPYGSSLWLRWPEVGIKLSPFNEKGTTMTVGRWRGDRLKTDWPDELVHGDADDWPWKGVWYRT